MLQNKIYKNFLIEIFKSFFTIIFGLSLIALTVRAVNFLVLIVDNGYSLLNIFGIAPKFFPIAFLISIIIFILRHQNNNEFIILWTTGVKKIVIVNLLLFSSVITIILYLIFSVYLTPLALNKSREMLGQSKFNSISPTVRAQQFSDSFKNLTFFVEEKINNEVRNIFLHDNGNNLKNFSSNKSDIQSTTIIAEKGIIEKKNLFLINGEIISKKKSQKNELIKFEQLNVNLKDLKTTVIKKPKLQETSTIKLMSCFFGQENKYGICNSDTKKEIFPVIIRRIILPTYLTVLCLICSFLLIKNQNFFQRKIPIFLSSFVILIFIELVLKYTGTNNFLRLMALFISL